MNFLEHVLLFFIEFLTNLMPNEYVSLPHPILFKINFHDNSMWQVQSNLTCTVYCFICEKRLSQPLTHWL